MIARTCMLLLALPSCDRPSPECSGASLLSGQVPAENLEASRAAWAELKASLGGSYCYDRSASYFSGERIAAAIRVSNERVVSRTVDSTHRGYRHEETDISRSDAFPGLTIDQLYDQCETEVLVQDRSTNTVRLVLADNGVLRQCFFVPNGCADDCVQGILIDHLTPSLE